MTETTVDHRTAPAPARPAPPAPPPAAPSTTVPPRTVPAPSVHEEVRVVLETARAVVGRGWLQHGWYETAPRSLRQKLFGPLPAPETLEGACLVAAVVVAGHAGGAFTQVDRDSGPSMDRLWGALQETRGHPADGPGAVAPIVRRARMRELVRWNDAPGRTHDEVMGLLDRAISATILDEARTPAAR